MKAKTRGKTLAAAVFVFLTTQRASTFSQQISIERTHGNNVVDVLRGHVLHSRIPMMTLGEPTATTRGIHRTDAPNSQNGFTWSLRFSVTGKVFKDVYFVNPQVGYLVTELGAVYKTTDGGAGWQTKLNLGFPYYWYGVDALSPDTVVIAGFNDQGNISTGVVRWSYDGGNTWGQDIVLRIPALQDGWTGFISSTRIPGSSWRASAAGFTTQQTAAKIPPRGHMFR